MSHFLNSVITGESRFSQFFSINISFFYTCHAGDDVDDPFHTLFFLCRLVSSWMSSPNTLFSALVCDAELGVCR